MGQEEEEEDGQDGQWEEEEQHIVARSRRTGCDSFLVPGFTVQKLS